MRRRAERGCRRRGWVRPPTLRESHFSIGVYTAGLARAGIYLYYLPAYSPELNRIEPVFKQAKHHDIPVRSYTTKADLHHQISHLHHEISKLTWKIIAWTTGICTLLTSAVYVIARIGM